jgi:hypothetical protein
MQIWTDRGRITVEFDQLDGIELAFDVFEDGFAIAAWLDQQSGKVIEFVEVGEA